MHIKCRLIESRSFLIMRSCCCYYLVQVRDPEFLEILGPAPKVHLIANTDAHEGGVYHPATNEFFFASSRFKIPYSEMLSLSERSPAAGRQNAEVKKVSVATGEVSNK
jgi:hypothetical protein